MTEQRPSTCPVCETPDGDHLDWCTPQARGEKTEQRPSKERVCPAHGAFPGGCCHMCGWSLDDEMPSVPTPYIGRIDAALAQWRGPGQEWTADDPKVLLLLNLLNGVLLHSRRTAQPRSVAEITAAVDERLDRVERELDEAIIKRVLPPLATTQICPACGHQSQAQLAQPPGDGWDANGSPVNT